MNKPNPFKAAGKVTDASQRFNKKREAEVKPFVDAAPTMTRKRKVSKKQKPFRLPLDVIEDLAFVCFATSSKEQQVGEKGITSEVRKMVEKLKKEHGEDGYNNLRKVFDSTR